MARTVSYWYDQIITEKETQATLNGLLPNIDNSQTLLQDLTTSSKVAIWRLQAWIIAVAIWTLDILFDQHKEEVEAIAAASRPGTERWYQELMFKFQFGYNLLYDSATGQYKYSALDPAAQIIKRVAVIELGGANRLVRIKVAKLVGNVVTQLDAQELASANAYLKPNKYAGVATYLTSGPPDHLQINLTVYYDPLVLSPTGESLLNPGTFPVEDAINSYISTLDFNGRYVNTFLIDEIQKASGVKIPILNSASAKYGSLPYAPIANDYIPDAGHMILDPLIPIANQITYLPA